MTRIRRNPAPTVVLAISMIAATSVALPPNPFRLVVVDDNADDLSVINQNVVPGRLSFAPVGSGRMAPAALDGHSAPAKWTPDRLDVACDRQLILSCSP